MMSHGRKYRDGDSHPLPLWSGILEHCGRIDQALWEFVWLLDKITDEPNGTGIVLGGAPVKIGRIAKDLGRHEQTVRRNMDRLEINKYIDRTRTPYGFVIRVKNSHKFHIWKRKEIAGFARSDVQKSTISPPNLHDLTAKFARNKEDKAVDATVDAAAEAAPVPDSLNPWKLLGSCVPMGSAKFQKLFEHYASTRSGKPLSEAMERAIQRANKEGVKVPPPFYEAKRGVERREAEEIAAPGEIQFLPEIPFKWSSVSR